MGFPCRPDGTCPFLYECSTASNNCEHFNVFPLTTYPIIIYCLFPFCSAMCNMSGNSFGEYKVILLMDLLNYQANQATILTYPLITGTALFNAISLIFKRHPDKNTSLIDYNIIMVLLPNNLFGSAIGGLVNKFIPPIVSDCLCLVLMIAFSFKFFMRYKGYKKQQLAQQSENQIEFTTKHRAESKQGNASVFEDNDKQQIESIGKVYSEREKTQRQSFLKQITQKKNTIYAGTESSQQLKQYLQYESGLHLHHILATIIIFLVFETLSFLAQGKIVSFSICTDYYPIGMSLLTIVFLIFDFGMYKYTVRRMRWYREIGYDYEIELDSVKNYALVCLGGFVGGFNGGVFGIGASTTMIFTLLYLKTIPSVISATVGFEVFFIGLGSLCQAMATNEIQLGVAGFFILLTLVPGGVLTFFARKFLNRFSQIKINQCLMLIVFCLVTCSSLALIVSIILGYIEFGAQNMDSIAFSC